MGALGNRVLTNTCNRVRLLRKLALTLRDVLAKLVDDNVLLCEAARRVLGKTFENFALCADGRDTTTFHLLGWPTCGRFRARYRRRHLGNLEIVFGAARQVLFSEKVLKFWQFLLRLWTPQLVIGDNIIVYLFGCAILNEIQNFVRFACRVNIIVLNCF